MAGIVRPQAAVAALTFTVDPNGWPAGWYDAAVANMQTVVNEYNAYGDFTTNNSGNINVYYNAGIPTAQSGYGPYGGSIGVGGTYPNVRVLLHESSHWLGTGTENDWWGGPNATAMLQQFEGLGMVLNGDTQHYWPYGENFDDESSPINDARHIAMVYALREDFGIGSTARPSSATSVTMTASDASGTSGFNYPWGWSDGHFAQAGTTYSTGNYVLRIPASSQSWEFAGDSLTVNNTNGSSGGLQYNGTGNTNVVTFKNLILDGGYVRHASTTSDVFQVAGKVTLAHAPTIDAAQGNINISAAIGGSGSLTKTGPYMLSLTGVNNYTGPTTISAGTLRLGAATAIASYSFANISGTTVVNDGSGGASMNGVLNTNGGSGFINTTGGPAAGMGALVLNGTGTTVDVNSGVTDLGGSGAWTVSAWIKTTQAGATILNKGDGTNWNSGFSTFYLGDGSDGGSGGLPDAVRWGGGWVAGAATVNNGAWHQVTYTNQAGTKTIYVDGVAQSISQNQFSNADTGSMIRFGFSPAGESDGNVIPSGSLSGIKIFGSALSASQVAQLYTGGRMSSVLPTTTDVTIAAGAVLDVNGVNQMIGSLTGPVGSAIKLGSGGQLAVSSSANTTFAGNISGAGGASFTKNGSGVLSLSGANTYTGQTTITGGTLQLSNPTAITAATPVASYTFSHISGSTVINDGSGGAIMNGTLKANGGSGSINTTGGPLAGLGALVLNGNGTTVDINSGVTDLSSNSNWTLSTWIKTTQAGATILNKGDGTNWTSGFSTFYLGTGSNSGSGTLPDAVRWGGGWVAGSTNVADGSWHLLTYTDADGTKMVYVDGVAEALSQNQFLNTDTGTKIRIGFAPTNVDGELPTSGSLSGINLYNTALTAAQVGALYTGGVGSPLPFATAVSIASGATLDVNGVTQTIGSLFGPAGANVTLGAGRLTVASTVNSEFDGAISGVGGSLTKSGTGSLTLAGSNSYTGITTVQGGTLILRGAGAQNPVLNGTSGADLKAGRLLLDYSGGGSDPIAQVRTILGAGYASNFATGPIHSSNTPDMRKGIGYFDNATSSQVALMYTWYGDANLDGQVNIADFNTLATNFGTASGVNWQTGDFNYDGSVNLLDLNAIASNFGASPIAGAAPPALGTLVPEPASISVLLAGSAAIMARRRRKA
ncbi:MAG TPA: autotransporter-associated beta strand repeat-containing protein [Tepidisphaeraceae bacterium]|nr:autotransporter-associated beta strand repeat-containing protein [Tepidisphaeraceae bacterium]